VARDSEAGVILTDSRDVLIQSDPWQHPLVQQLVDEVRAAPGAATPLPCLPAGAACTAEGNGGRGTGVFELSWLLSLWASCQICLIASLPLLAARCALLPPAGRHAVQP
jgi:hypothetical protein